MEQGKGILETGLAIPRFRAGPTHKVYITVSDDVGLFIDLMADVGWEGEDGESMGAFQA